MHPQLNREIAEFLRQVEPIGSKQHRLWGELLASCCLPLTESENPAAPLLRVGLEFVKECRDDGNMCFKQQMRNEALKHYTNALRTVEWAAGLLFFDDDHQNESSSAMWTAMVSHACACISNGALSLIQMQKFPKAQRWCQRGVKHIEELKARGSLDEATASVGVKIRFRLGQALENQGEFGYAIAAYENCAKQSPAAAAAAAAAAAEGDCAPRIAECRKKLEEQRARERAKMSQMFV